ncbi:MAG: DUF2066 domain-containing protein [Thiomicrorhabdus sp.]|nr:DUF2066 domain-containing protein [Thiomicrorhabdus sp.]
MRSFRLLVLFLLLNAVSSVCVSAPMGVDKAQEHRLFTVTLLYHNGEQTIESTLQEAMATLLVRLTGQKTFLTSRVAQIYLKNPKSWLKNYDITPRVEEGVIVGKNIVYTFLEDKLRQEFRQRFMPIWPLSKRPNTLVMGALVQGGTLIRLDEARLDDRLDADFRHYPNKVMLPITLPNLVNRIKNDWILPVESAQTASGIQVILAKLDLPYLLSFKVVMNGGDNNRLTWALYDQSGEKKLSGVQNKGVVTILTEKMFDQVMQYYAQITSQSPIEIEPDRQTIQLTIYGVEGLDQMLFFERLLASNPQEIRSVELVSMQLGQVQYRITPQSTYQSVLNWIQSWPQLRLEESRQEQGLIITRVRAGFSLHQPKGN